MYSNQNLIRSIRTGDVPYSIFSKVNNDTLFRKRNGNWRYHSVDDSCNETVPHVVRFQYFFMFDNFKEETYF